MALLWLMKKKVPSQCGTSVTDTLQKPTGFNIPIIKYTKMSDMVYRGISLHLELQQTFTFVDI